MGLKVNAGKLCNVHVPRPSTCIGMSRRVYVCVNNMPAQPVVLLFAHGLSELHS